MSKRLLALLVAVTGMLALTAGSVAAPGNGNGDANKLQQVQHIVVIYEENHSFDNLYGGWEGINGRDNADVAHTTQVNQAGTPYTCLKQDDVNLTAPPLSATCTDSTTATTFTSHFANAPFTIDDYIQPGDHTCPPTLQAFSFPNGILKTATKPDGSFVGLPGGCTRDIVHRYYQEIYQLHVGQQDRYVTGSDAIGLTMGYYDTLALPIYKYLHENGHPKYAILDNFFQAAFGGSFLNHQFLIAAAPPQWPGAPATQHAILDANGFPNATYPLYTPTKAVRDGIVTQLCAPDANFVSGFACGDAVVNTAQPIDRPHGAFGARIPKQVNPTIGDRLNAAGVDWAWYAGGWSNADGDVGQPGYTNGTAANPANPTNGCYDPDVDPSVTGPTANPPNEHISQWPYCPNNLFQYHHQPFNYFQTFSRTMPDGVTPNPAGVANRQAHLRDEQEFIDLANGSTSHCDLKPVSFVKPIGQENEHPGYASTPVGSSHLVDLLSSIENSACKENTMVIVTYDEFGGQWDHVSPPGMGGNTGPHDQWGPGTRIPALVLGPHLKGPFVVDHTQYDTTSILRTIEQRYDLAPVATRDAEVNSLSDVFDAQKP
jgi:phospholipase C